MNLVKILATGNFSSRRDLARFPARLWPPGISLPAEILGKILAAGNFPSRRDFRQDSRRDFGHREFHFPPRIPPGMKIPPAKISPGSRRDSRWDSRQVPAKIPVLFLQGQEANIKCFPFIII